MVDTTTPRSDLSPLAAAPSSTVIVGFNDRSYVDWSAVIGGSFIASALWLLLTSFGASIGLFVAVPWRTASDSAATLSITTAAWFAIVQLFAITAGAYLSGRLRQRVDGGPTGEIAFRDGANGLLVWAVGLLVTAVMVAITAVAGITAATATKDPAVQTTDTAIVIDRLFRPEPTPQSGTEASSSEQTGFTIVPRRRADRVNRDEVARILAERDEDGTIPAADKSYLASLVAANTNLNPSEAKERVDQTLSEWSKQQEAAAEEASKTAALVGLWTVAILLISGLAAWWAGWLGGTHRDDFK